MRSSSARIVPKIAAQLHEMMPILVVAGHAAHINPEDDTHMIHGNFGQEAVKSGSPFGRLASDSLVLVDE